MTISESERFELHVGLEKILGDKLTNTLMEHLPPSGWSDVARRADLDHLERMMEMRFQEIDRRLGRFDGTLKFLVGIAATAGIGLLAIQVQIMVSIANL